MASKLRGQRRENTRAGKGAPAQKQLPLFPELREDRTRAKEFKPMNKAQERYVNMINNNTITFGIGPAGTGKSFCAAAVAAAKFKNKEIDRIIISRPAVEAGESLGFLPGEMEDKFAPYVAPIMDCLSKILGKSYVEALIENEKIVLLPLAFSRGWTFDRSFVILDEAQNVTKTQMKLFLTRIGNDTTVVIDGDLSQRDGDFDGLYDAIKRLDHVRSVGVMRFHSEDIVRSGIVKDIVMAYSDEEVSHEEETDTIGLERFINSE